MNIQIERLSPEKQNAFTVYKSCHPLLSEICSQPRQLNLEDFFTNSVVGSNSYIKPAKLPAAHPWKWNQSKAKFSFSDTNNEWVVEVKKLKPRVRTNYGPHTNSVIPTYKLWSYTSKHIPTSATYNFFWCEKGVEKTSMATLPIATNTPFAK